MWRFFGVRERERGRVLFFVTLSSLVSLALTLGLVATEALFLARRGIEALPAMFVIASAFTVLGSLLYGLGVGAYRNDSFFCWMLIGAAGLLCAGGGISDVDPGLAASVLFCFYFVTQAIFLNHYWTFAGDYFDTLTTKRLFPLFAAGNSVGGVLGGCIALGVSLVASAEALIYVWAFFLALSAGLLRLERRRLRRWGPLELEEADETSVSGLRDALRYIRRSPLGQWLVVSILGMTLCLFVAQYLYLGAIAREFPEAAQLAAFLGLYLAASNLVEIVLEVWPVPRLIQRLGVARANLVHPWLTLGSFAALALDPRLLTALLSRANRELLSSALAEPVRNLVYNALPFRFRGRIRAFLEGIAAHAGMTLAGGLLLLIPTGIAPLWLSVLGAATALLYVLSNLAVRREYVRALAESLRAGRLDFSDVGELGRWEASGLAELWPSMLAEHGARPTRLDLEVAPLLARRGIFEPLIGAAEHGAVEVRRAAVAALSLAPPPVAGPALRRALEDQDAGVRLAAVAAHGADGAAAVSLLEARLGDPAPAVRAEAALKLGQPGRAVLEQMAGSRDAACCLPALERLPADLLFAALARIDDQEPGTRAAALESVARLARPVPVDPTRLGKELSHGDLRVRRAAVRGLATLDSQLARRLLVSAFDDRDRSVVDLAQQALGAMGDSAIEAVRPRLGGEPGRSSEAAVRTLGKVDTVRSRALLRGELTERVRDGWRARVMLHGLESFGATGVDSLCAAWQNSAQGSLRLAFAILEETEDPAIMRAVDRVLRFASPRARGDALEVVANLGDQETARLLVLSLEDLPMSERLALAPGGGEPPRSLAAALNLSRASTDPWIRRAALAYDAARRGDGAEEEAMNRLLLLRRVPLFSQLSLAQVEEIDRILVEERYLPNEVIYREGDPGDRLYVLAEGGIEVWKNYGSPNQVRLAAQDDVSCFGEMGVLDESPRSATIVAAEDTRLLSLDGTQLKELIMHRPEIAFDFFSVLATRVRHADQRFEDAVLADGTQVRA